MAWVAVDRYGEECVFRTRPKRNINNVSGKWGFFYLARDGGYLVNWGVDLPKGSIKKLIGKELTWDDEPFEIK